MNYKIITDSAANLFKLEDAPFAFVPLTIHCGEREFTDTPALDREEMLQYLKETNQRSTTSCPNVADWLESFGDAEEIYAVTITGSLSGSYSAAVQAKELYLQKNPAARVYILNSLSAGPEMALIVEKIAECKNEGKSFEETVATIEDYKTHTHLCFCLSSLRNLARNGRVSPAIAKLVGVLGIRIVGKASDEGTLQQLHKSRGQAKSLETLLMEMKNNGFTGGKVRIAHCKNQAAADLLKQIILSYAPACPIRIEECGALCSFYAEEGGMLIGFED